MSSVGQREIETQKHVIAFFRDALGYAYLGHWKDREGNANVDEMLLTAWLKRQGHSDKSIGKVVFELGKAAALGGSKTLYDANREVYGLLRYGVRVRPEVGEQTETVWLIDWEDTDNNDFAVAEEVTVFGVNTKRPDVVLYVNGIALGVLELKRSTVSVREGIRQNLDSQKKEFIRPFYTTVQLVMAGNDTEGLRYSVIETPEKYWLRWKEADAHQEAGENPLLRELGQMCGRARMLEIVHDFMVFDAGIKKICRHNQYFGVRAAQARVVDREGGTLWHTQGSGKSLIMVWLAKWIREHVLNSRVLILTDRTELDEQIEKVFKGVSEAIYRTKSGADLVRVLNTSEEWLLCSLIHKFGASDEGDVDAFVEDIKSNLPKGFRAKGALFVFVDECHRTQSGKLHEAMKALLPDAMLIGFTGTPLLKSDKRRSIETFGPYIHTYKYDEAVRDGVVLDLRYEARDIDQRITSQAKVDQWFELKTSGLTDVAKAQLKQRWGTMQKVLSARDRLETIVADIMMDMATRDRLKSGHGNAILVCGSIYSACRFFDLFQQTDLAGKCAIVTSYRPQPVDIKGEETGEGLTEKLRQYEIYRKMLAAHFNEPVDAAMAKVEQFEKEAKQRFIEQPGQMKLLIVVDKLLTGFDAPPCTYLYIDKSMQDHGLFQAICRVNRLDGEDKDFGYIVDYKDLFKKVENAIAVYTSELDRSAGGADPEVLLQDRLKKGRERLDQALETLVLLCEPVEPPKGELEHIHYFCGNTEIPADLQKREPQRAALYKGTVALVRAYANIADELEAAGYGAAEITRVKQQLDQYLAIREIIRKASGESLDLKAYEADMRHLLDTYIEADEPRKISPFNNMGLLELVVKTGIANAIATQLGGLKGNKNAVAETIENNVRRKIIKEHLNDPAYYDKMSALLDEIIAARRSKAIAYEEYLRRIAELANRVEAGQAEDAPVELNTPGRRALYNNLKPGASVGNASVAADPTASYENAPKDDVLELAVKIDETVKRTRPDGWRGVQARERVIKAALYGILQNETEVERIFLIIKQQKEY